MIYKPNDFTNLFTPSKQNKNILILQVLQLSWPDRTAAVNRGVLPNNPSHHTAFPFLSSSWQIPNPQNRVTRSNWLEARRQKRVKGRLFCHVLVQLLINSSAISLAFYFGVVANRGFDC